MAPKCTQNMTEKEERENLQPDPLNDNFIQIDDEDEPEATGYYDISGQRMQISESGISSLEDGEYVNDEIINAAFLNIQKQFPCAHVFDTLTSCKIFDAFEDRTSEDSCEMTEAEFNRHFGSMFLKRSSYESRPIDETFFSKKMLIFPINHVNHWFLMVVVNPLLADVVKHEQRETEAHVAAAYYLDSLIGTANYTHEVMHYRLDLTWICIFSFLRLGALYHSHADLQPSLISCHYENNIPSQVGTFDCGPHTVINARLMANRFDELAKGPELLVISQDEEDQVMEDVAAFRETFKAYLESCKTNPS